MFDRRRHESEDHTASLCPPPPMVPPVAHEGGRIHSATKQQYRPPHATQKPFPNSKRNTPPHSHTHSDPPTRKRGRKHNGSPDGGSSSGKLSGRGFKTVTVAVPGCPVQQFQICVGNHPDDVKQWIQERKKRFPRQSKATDDRRKEEKTTILSGLLDTYESSSEDVDEAQQNNTYDKNPEMTDMQSKTRDPSDPKDSHGKSLPSVNQNNASIPLCRYYLRNGRCRNGDACAFSHESPPRNISCTKSESMKRNHNRSRNSNHTSQETLLQKLLKIDSRREAILSLQLLRYIVDSNWLEQPPKKTPK